MFRMDQPMNSFPFLSLSVLRVFVLYIFIFNIADSYTYTFLCPIKALSACTELLPRDWLISHLC